MRRSAQAVGENPADSDGNDVANSINTSEFVGRLLSILNSAFCIA
jgi:hypothetical protein